MPNKNIKRKSKDPDFFEQPSSLRNSAQNPTCLISPQDLKEISPIGEGFFANVVLGKWLRPNRKEQFVAIKSIKDGIIEGHLEDVMREANTMIHLEHGNIIRLYGISLLTHKYPMGIQLVTEYASFGSLYHVLKVKDKPEFLQVTRLWLFAGQIADGMDYLAKAGLVHRDLAARNVLVVEPQLVRISDFGLAKALDQGQRITPGREMAVAWCAPEIFRAEPLTHKCDVWSYGVLLWEMFSFAKTPWAEVPVMQVMMKMTTDQPRLEKPKACSPEVYELMMFCWQQDPVQRPDFSEIHSTLMTIEFKTGVAKEDVWVSEVGGDGRLKFTRNSIVTVIARTDGLWTGQNDEGKVGLFYPRFVDFKRDMQAMTPKDKKKNISKMEISQPFNPTLKTTAQILEEMNIPQDHEVRQIIQAQRKDMSKKPEQKEEKPANHSLPRPEPIGGMLRDDGYLIMNDGIKPEEEFKEPRNEGAARLPGGKDAGGGYNRIPKVGKAENPPPAIPERTDLKPHGADGMSTVMRRRPVPTPRKERMKKALSTPDPLEVEDVANRRVRSQSQRDWNDIRRDSDEISLSDTEAEHPSLVPLLPGTSAPDDGSRQFLGSYCLLGEEVRNSSDEEEDSKVVDRRGDSFENKGYSQVIMIASYDDEAADEDPHKAEETPDEISEEDTSSGLCFANEEYFRMDQFSKRIEERREIFSSPCAQVGKSQHLENGDTQTPSDEIDAVEPLYANKDGSDEHTEGITYENVKGNFMSIISEDVETVGRIEDELYSCQTYYENMVNPDFGEVNDREMKVGEESPPLVTRSSFPGATTDGGVLSESALATKDPPPLPSKHRGANDKETVTVDEHFYESVKESGGEFGSCDFGLPLSREGTDQTNLKGDAPPPLPQKDILSRINAPCITSTLPRPLFPTSSKQNPTTSDSHTMTAALLDLKFDGFASGRENVTPPPLPPPRVSHPVDVPAKHTSSPAYENMKATTSPHSRPLPELPLPGSHPIDVSASFSSHHSSLSSPEGSFEHDKISSHPTNKIPLPELPIPESHPMGAFPPAEHIPHTSHHGERYPAYQRPLPELPMPNSHPADIPKDSFPSEGQHCPHLQGAPYSSRVSPDVLPSPGDPHPLFPNQHNPFAANTFDTNPVHNNQCASKHGYRPVPPPLPPPPVIDPTVLNQPAPTLQRRVTASDILLSTLGITTGVSNNSGTLGETRPPNQSSEEETMMGATGVAADHISDYRHASVDLDSHWVNLEGPYREDMRRIHSELPHLSFEECKSAFLRYEGDADTLIKVIKVCSLTGVCEEEVKFHLGHCGWDVERAVNYIFDKMS